MKFDNRTDIETFINVIQKLILENVKDLVINDIEIKIGEDFGVSLSADDRVPQKNIEEIEEREKLALAYKRMGNMDMAATEFEECARELLLNCINATLNISTKNTKRLNAYLSESRKCWHDFSGDFILPSQSKQF